MRTVRARETVAAPLGMAERLWLDPQRWAAWIDGFGHVVKIEGEWPGPGARAVWDSRPEGRGRVVEVVREHVAGTTHAVEVEDPKIRGTQRVSFAAVEGGVTVELELAYELKERNVVTPVVDLLFVRRAFLDSLRRTTYRFARELESEAELLK